MGQNKKKKCFKIDSLNLWTSVDFALNRLGNVLSDDRDSDLIAKLIFLSEKVKEHKKLLESKEMSAEKASCHAKFVEYFVPIIDEFKAREKAQKVRVTKQMDEYSKFIIREEIQKLVTRIKQASSQIETTFIANSTPFDDVD